MSSWFRIPPPDRPVAQWHVSPLVDLAAYAFSWAWVLVPMATMGPSTQDYLFYYLLILAATDVHRHYGLPYVYLDSQIRRRYPLRFTLFPLALLALWGASPYLESQPLDVTVPQIAGALAVVCVLLQMLARDGGERRVTAADAGKVALPGLAVALGLTLLSLPIDAGWWWLLASLLVSALLDRRLDGPRFRYAAVIATGTLFTLLWGGSLRTVPIKTVLNNVAVFAGLWNFWHVYMQKYGILRLYNAKSGNAAKVAGWLDRSMLFAWLPLYFAQLGPLHQRVAYDAFGQARGVLPPVLGWLTDVRYLSVPICTLLLVTALAAWVRAEWQANRMRNKPRLAMAVGTNLLAASFLVLDPIKVYLAFAFSHAVEYMVFVWAFQRRRYQQPLEHKPLLGRILRHPATAYLAFILGVGATFSYLKFTGKYFGSGPPVILGYTTWVWMKYWGVYQSMVHFYFDGFLWKMRMPSVRANI